jgi:hypothetical protein
MKTQRVASRSLCVLVAALLLAFACYGQVTISQSVRNDTSPPLWYLVATAPVNVAPDVPQLIPLMVIPPPAAQGARVGSGRLRPPNIGPVRMWPPP